MADRIKGLTIEIDGNTTKLSKALEGVNKDIKNTQTQLKDVEKLLKLDPGNIELLKQKQELLSKAVEETKEKLEKLKEAQSQMDAAGVDKNSEEYQALQREIIATENELKNLKSAADESNAALNKIAEIGDKMKTAGDKIAGVGQSLTKNVTGPLLAASVAAVKVTADFDAAMSKVSAVSGAVGEDLDRLREKAREMGAKTKFSATQAAEAFNYMAMAGWKTEDMLDGIEGIMNLAAASGEELGVTSDIVTDALTAFNLTAEDSTHFADVLAAASSNANTNVAMMGETFKYVAPIAGAMGYSIEDTAEAIGLMANAGIKSSQAGTSLRRVMTSLQGEVTLVGESFGEVTIQTANTDGTMRDLTDILNDCRAAFSQMTESERAAQAQALVGQHALSGFLALMNAAPKDIEKLRSSIASASEEQDGYNGTAEKMAATMQDNLSGQIVILKSQLEELAISIGDTLVPTIREIVGKIQEWVDKFNSLDDSTKETIVQIGLITAAVGPILLIIGKIISVIGTVMTMLPQIAAVISTVKTAILALNTAMLANPIFLIIAAIGALIAIFITLWNNCEGFREFWINLWEKIKEVASVVWEAITGFVSGAWEKITGFVSNIKDTAVSQFNEIKEGASEKFNAVKEGAQVALNAAKEVAYEKLAAIKQAFDENGGGIKGAMAAAWEGIKGAYTAGFDFIDKLTGGKLSKIKDAIFGKFKEIIDSAKNWGRDLIQNLIDGILGMIDKVKGAIGNVADTIASFIHFSLPDKGPLAKANTFMPDMIDLLTKGIKDNLYKVEDTMSQLSGTLVPQTNVNVSYNDAGVTSRLDSIGQTLNNQQPTPVKVVLEGDARGVFNLVRTQNEIFERSTGNSAFA